MSQTDLELQTTSRLDKATAASRYWRDGASYRTMPELDRLAHLQHHIGGTPLLDVTPDPMVALWSACQSPPGGTSDGLLIGFNAHDELPLDDRRTYKEIIADLMVRKSVGWYVPPAVNDRIVVQRGRFMLSWLESTGRWHEHLSDVWLPDLPTNWSTGTPAERAQKLDTLFTPSVGRPASIPAVAFLIPRADKSWILNALEKNYGVSRTTVYPDVHGLVSGAYGSWV